MFFNIDLDILESTYKKLIEFSDFRKEQLSTIDQTIKGFDWFGTDATALNIKWEAFVKETEKNTHDLDCTINFLRKSIEKYKETQKNIKNIARELLIEDSNFIPSHNTTIEYNNSMW